MNEWDTQTELCVNDGQLEIDPNDVRLTDLLLGGVLGYELLGHQHHPMGGYPPQYQQLGQPQYQQQQPPAQQMPPQPHLPYPPNFIPSPQYAAPITNLNQAVAYVNRYFYFWPVDDQSLGYWIFVTYIDGLGIRGYHFNGQAFTEVKISPDQIKAFYVY